MTDCHSGTEREGERTRAGWRWKLTEGEDMEEEERATGEKMKKWGIEQGQCVSFGWYVCATKERKKGPRN